MENIEIRESARDDLVSIGALYPVAFPDEDLLPLVKALLRQGPVTLSLVAVVGASLVGHVIFTSCGITGSGDTVALLGPLAVAPAWQRQGVGRALVRAGTGRMEAAGATRVCVLGDPAYYGRLGFAVEAHIAPPYRLPAEWRTAWRSIGLGDTEHLPDRCKLITPQAWMQPSLWTS